MRIFRWNAKKNEALKATRGLSFESVVVAIESGGLLDIVAHPNKAKYPRQRVLVVAFDNYALPGTLRGRERPLLSEDYHPQS